MRLKATYNLSDFLSWTFEKNFTLFKLAATENPEFTKAELSSYFFHIAYRKRLLDAVGIEAPKTSEVQDEINSVFFEIAMYCQTLIDDETRSWLHARGVTDEQIKKHKIGSNANYNPFVPWLSSEFKKYKNCFLYPPLIQMDEIIQYYGKQEMKLVTIPFFDVTGTKVTNLCSRILDDDFSEVFKFFFSHGPTAVFNVNNIDLTQPFYVFEGVFDTLTAERLGIPSVALGSSSVCDEQYEFIKKHPKAILCLDGDLPGVQGMQNVSDDVQKFWLPNGYDPDDILRKDPGYASTLKDIVALG